MALLKLRAEKQAHLKEYLSNYVSEKKEKTFVVNFKEFYKDYQNKTPKDLTLARNAFSTSVNSWCNEKGIILEIGKLRNNTNYSFFMNETPK